MVNIENIVILKILEDARASRIYLEKTENHETPRARRCVNLLENVAWLMGRNAQMIKLAANKFGWANHDSLGHYIKLDKKLGAL